MLIAQHPQLLQHVHQNVKKITSVLQQVANVATVEDAGQSALTKESINIKSKFNSISHFKTHMHKQPQ